MGAWLTLAAMIGVVPRSGRLGRGVLTHPPRNLPPDKSAGILLAAVFLGLPRQRRQATLPTLVRLGNIFMTVLCMAHLAAAGAAPTRDDAEHLAGKKLASVRCGCAHLHGSTSPTLGTEAVQTLAAQAKSGLAVALMMRGMEPAFGGMEMLGHAASTANQFEGAHSRLGRGGSATASQQVQFEGAPTRLGMRGLEAARRRRWRGTSLTSTMSEPSSGRDFMTKLTMMPSPPPRRGSRRFARGSQRAPVAATVLQPPPPLRRQRERSWALPTLERLLNRQLKTLKFTRTCSGRTTAAASRRRWGGRHLLPLPMPRTRLGTRPGPTRQHRELGLSS